MSAIAAAVGHPVPVRRRALGGMQRRLFFAQVREDPLLEIDALAPGPASRVVVVSSGGCTALSLLAHGAGEVIAADLNHAQNHLLELKLAAAELPALEALAFLGAVPSSAPRRLAAYRLLRPALGPAARRYWDDRRTAIARGVLAAGVSERFIRLVVRAMRLFVHGERTVLALLACRSLEEQRALYDRQWNTRRWRALFAVLLGRRAFSRAYDPAFFRHVENPSFAQHFHERCEHALRELPVETNYFLHHMLSGRYPADVPDGLPPYLDGRALAALRERREQLELVDGGVTELLRTQPPCSVTGFAISNICEWMTPREIDELFAEIVRTATRGATLVFRNFVGWTEVPDRWRHLVVEDRPRGEAMIARDRSVVQRRIAVCQVRRAG